MKVIRKQDRLIFQNFERREEREIFDEAAKILRQQEALILEKEKLLPYCDIIEGECEGSSFSLIHDLDYGTDLVCDDNKTLEKLEAILKG